MKNQYDEEKSREYSLEYLKKEETNLRKTVEIVCDHCGKHLGISFEYDLEGSRFVCDDCYKEISNKDLIN